MIIAVDGPTASGKGTIAKALAAHFGLPHLDTGLLYRAVGVAIAGQEGLPDFADAAISAARHLDISVMSRDPAPLQTAEAGALAGRMRQKGEMWVLWPRDQVPR